MEDYAQEVLLPSIVREAVEQAGRDLERTAEQVKPDSLGETNHFTPALRAGLVKTAARVGVEPGDLRGKRVALAGWPSVGPFDLRLDAGRGRVALLELKWGALDEVVWDVCKLALAVTELKALTGFVVVGAPTRKWDRGLPGATLLDTAQHRTADLRANPYRSAWDVWERRNDPRPDRLPPVVHTEAVCSVDLDLGSQEWRLRAAAVTADPDLVEDVEDLDERWRDLATPAALVFYDETLTAHDKQVRLRELADRAGADTPDRTDAHGYIRSLHRREQLGRAQDR